jgi:hypothetical protein
MRTIHLRLLQQKDRGVSPVLALLVIVGLVCLVVFVRWYMKSAVKDPDLCYDLKPWKEWRLRESSQKPKQELSTEQPAITDLLKFDTNLSDAETGEPRGELGAFIGPGGSVSGSWYGLYWKTRTRNFQVMGGNFKGKVYPAKIYRSETGEQDPSKLYLMAKYEFLVQETDTEQGKVYNRAGDIYVQGWLAKEYVLTGKVTITSDEKYFETFTWKTYRTP